MKDYCRHALLNVEFSRRRANYCGGGGGVLIIGMRRGGQTDMKQQKVAGINYVFRSEGGPVLLLRLLLLHIRSCFTDDVT